MIEIQNTQECFVQLWLRLERTRRLLGAQHKRFCIRSVLKSWFGLRATDDFIWEVCHLCGQEGWNELPLPSLYPRKHREFLRAIVAVTTGISFYRVNLKALDAAYSEAFPNSTAINVNKKGNPSPSSTVANGDSPLRASVRIIDSSPHQAQKDIQSFLRGPSSPLCGAESTFSTFSKDPSRPRGGELLALSLINY